MFFDDDYNYGMDIMNTNYISNNTSNILGSSEAFLRGNSFKDEYLPYKKYSYLKLNPTNREEKLLYEIMSLCFIINDLNLYLDLHSNDKETFELFKKYVKEEENLEKKYINEFGPLTLNDTLGATFNWIKDFPWENKRGDIYV